MSLDRRAATDALGQLAFCAELLDDARVDAKAVGGLAWALRSLEGSTEELVAHGALERMDGMSAPLLAVVDDALHGRTPTLLDELTRALPAGLLEMQRIKGLGPKKIRALWRDLEITSVGELEYACRENRLVTLKGFGDKTQASVLAQIEALRAQHGLMRLDDAASIASRVEAAARVAGARAVCVAGEARRSLELVSSVCLVVCGTSDMARTALETLALDDAGARSVATHDDGTVIRVTLTAGGVTVVLRVVGHEHEIGRAILEETGPEAHVERVRKHARARSVVIETLAAETDDAIYDALGVWPTPPERRDADVPLVAKAQARPRLITRADLLGALHNHTDASDGTASLEEMRAAARARGLRYLGVTDHSKSAAYAHGLDDMALEAQRQRIDALNQEPDASCMLLSGVESDILRDGALDYADAVLRDLDIVVASVHQRFGQRRDAMTARMLSAARHPLTDIVGHPTGRLLLGRAPAEYDVGALIDACAEVGCALELNANPARLDLDEHALALAKERGVLISIAADAHAPDELDALSFGIGIARRAGLFAEDVLNTRTLEELQAWRRARRASAGVP